MMKRGGGLVLSKNEDILPLQDKTCKHKISVGLDSALMYVLEGIQIATMYEGSV